MSEKELRSTIEQYRQRMIKLAEGRSYVSKEVVEVSTLLDELLTQYQVQFGTKA